MRDPRKATDRRSPVQPGGSDAVKFIILAIVGFGAAWSVSDLWVGPNKAPYEPDRTSSTPILPGRPAPAEAARGNLMNLFTGDDYPIEALRNEEQGTVAVSLQIDTQGRVSRCTVSSTSGSDALDRTTCEILRSRARFTPATDTEGHPVPDVYSQRITWRLE